MVLGMLCHTTANATAALVSEATSSSLLVSALPVVILQESISHLGWITCYNGGFLAYVANGLVGVLCERHCIWDAPLHPEVELGQPSSGSTLPPQPVPEASCRHLQYGKKIVGGSSSARNLPPSLLGVQHLAPSVSREQATLCNKVGVEAES